MHGAFYGFHRHARTGVAFTFAARYLIEGTAVPWTARCKDHVVFDLGGTLFLDVAPTEQLDAHALIDAEIRRLIDLR